MGVVLDIESVTGIVYVLLDVLCLQDSACESFNRTVRLGLNDA
jgi:hypothetical protein